MKKVCKKCSETNIYKNGLCYEHFKEYAREYRRNNVERFRQYEINKDKKAKTRICDECGKEFNRYYVGMFCSHKCQGENWKKIGKRVGKNNPGFRNGFYVDRVIKKNKTATIHSNACRKYRTFFRKNNDYDYCERCGVSSSLRFEAHHIVFASEAPKHKELHNFKNLILLCINCHNELHKHKILRNDIVKERELDELFNRKLTIYEKKAVN